MRKIKVGIDVGGTFTHAVAINVDDYSIIGKSCVPTTHNSNQGVAEGVINSMFELIEVADISPEEIVLIAHSTTQATNALLEGDVAKVGIIALGQGIEGNIARKQAFLDDIELAPGKKLQVCFRYLNTSKDITDEKINQIIDELHAEGAEVFVATETFGPDNNTNEIKVAEIAAGRGFMATAACSLSQLYGLKVRTRTAVVNASMMPKMIETANLTEEAVRKSGVKAPLMVMRSDGGIMDISEMRKRPILTMLSGPAAGVTAALMYAKVSDGIFVEVGGTSTDISVIKNGMPQVKAAQIGKNRLSVKTIDVRTIGVGGGSIPRWEKGKIVDVGPRSAHIANLSYSAYTNDDNFSDIRLEKIQPKPGDPDDYLKIVRNDEAFTITPSAASYYLEYVKEFGHGQANMKAVNNSVNAVANIIGMKPEHMAYYILKTCSLKAEKIISGLMREYKLDSNFVELVGGGGGASAIVPHLSEHMEIKHLIANNAEVISAIGAAMGMIRDTIEKSIFNPSESDIVKIRQEAMESVISMGAVPSSVEVQVEIDNANKKVIAIAAGSSDLSNREGKSELSNEDLLKRCAEYFKTDKKELIEYGKTSLLNVIGIEKNKSHFLGLMKELIRSVVIIDNEGTIKRKFPNAKVIKTDVAKVKAVISDVIEELRSFGDAGELLPDIFVAVSGKIIDLSGLVELAQILSLIEYDLKDLSNDANTLVIAVKKK